MNQTAGVDFRSVSVGEVQTWARVCWKRPDDRSLLADFNRCLVDFFGCREFSEAAQRELCQTFPNITRSLLETSEVG